MLVSKKAQMTGKRQRKKYSFNCSMGKTSTQKEKQEKVIC